MFFHVVLLSSSAVRSCNHYTLLQAVCKLCILHSFIPTHWYHCGRWPRRFLDLFPPPPPRPRLTDILYYWPTGQFARSLNLFLTSPLSNTHSLSLDNSCSIPVRTSLSACDHTDHRRGTGPLPWLPSYNGWQIPATLLIFLPLLRRQPAVFVKKTMVQSSDFLFLCFCSGNNG